MSLTQKQIVGILLLVALALQLVQVPFIDNRGISLLLILGSAVYLLAVK